MKNIARIVILVAGGTLLVGCAPWGSHGFRAYHTSGFSDLAVHPHAR